jgi:hypothetical protein
MFWMELAKKVLIKNRVPQPRVDPLYPNDPEKRQTIPWQSEILFYRYSEIRRARGVGELQIASDLVLCLHFNADQRFFYRYVSALAHP